MLDTPRIPPPGPHDRYQTVVAMLRQILERLDTIEHDVDEIDRVLKPHGDGWKPRRRR